MFTTFRAVLLDRAVDRTDQRLAEAVLDPAARATCNDADSAQFLERFWIYLHRLACTQLSSRFAAKLDPSDLVQQTFLDAQQKLAQFRGTTDRERAAWLRQIFAHNLSDVLRDFSRQKRSVMREQSSEELAACLAEQPDTRADGVEETEQLYRLSWALSQLPQQQRRAIELHHLRGLSLAETAQHLCRTQASVAGLIRRGMAQLRELLIAPAA